MKKLELFIVAVILFGGLGYIWNVIKIIEAVSEPLTRFYLLRVAGVILIPLGAILGYF